MYCLYIYNIPQCKHFPSTNDSENIASGFQESPRWTFTGLTLYNMFSSSKFLHQCAKCVKWLRKYGRRIQKISINKSQFYKNKHVLTHCILLINFNFRFGPKKNLQLYMHSIFSKLHYTVLPASKELTREGWILR